MNQDRTKSYQPLKFPVRLCPNRRLLWRKKNINKQVSCWIRCIIDALRNTSIFPALPYPHVSHIECTHLYPILDIILAATPNPFPDCPNGLKGAIGMENLGPTGSGSWSFHSWITVSMQGCMSLIHHLFHPHLFLYFSYRFRFHESGRSECSTLLSLFHFIFVFLL